MDTIRSQCTARIGEYELRVRRDFEQNYLVITTVNYTWQRVFECADFMFRVSNCLNSPLDMRAKSEYQHLLTLR